MKHTPARLRSPRTMFKTPSPATTTMGNTGTRLAIPPSDSTTAIMQTGMPYPNFHGSARMTSFGYRYSDTM